MISSSRSALHWRSRQEREAWDLLRRVLVLVRHANQPLPQNINDCLFVHPYRLRYHREIISSQANKVGSAGPCTRPKKGGEGRSGAGGALRTANDMTTAFGKRPITLLRARAHYNGRFWRLPVCSPFPLWEAPALIACLIRSQRGEPGSYTLC